MIEQRPSGSAACVQGVAEALPLRDGSVDAALAVLTVHHWTDVEAGIAELRRVARKRIVILTWDQSVLREFWLVREYLPAAAAVSGGHAVPVHVGPILAWPAAEGPRDPWASIEGRVVERPTSDATAAAGALTSSTGRRSTTGSPDTGGAAR